MIEFLREFSTLPRFTSIPLHKARGRSLPLRSHAPQTRLSFGHPHDGKDGGENNGRGAKVANNPDDGCGNGGTMTLPVMFHEKGDGVPRHLRRGDVDNVVGGAVCHPRRWQVAGGRRPATAKVAAKISMLMQDGNGTMTPH